MKRIVLLCSLTIEKLSLIHILKKKKKCFEWKHSQLFVLSPLEIWSLKSQISLTTSCDFSTIQGWGPQPGDNMSGLFLTLHFKIQLWQVWVIPLGAQINQTWDIQRKHKSETRVVFIHCTFCLNVKSPYVEEVSTVLLEKFFRYGHLSLFQISCKGKVSVTFPLRDEL